MRKLKLNTSSHKINGLKASAKSSNNVSMLKNLVSLFTASGNLLILYKVNSIANNISNKLEVIIEHSNNLLERSVIIPGGSNPNVVTSELNQISTSATENIFQWQYVTPSSAFWYFLIITAGVVVSYYLINNTNNSNTFDTTSFINNSGNTQNLDSNALSSLITPINNSAQSSANDINGALLNASSIINIPRDNLLETATIGGLSSQASNIGSIFSGFNTQFFQSYMQFNGELVIEFGVTMINQEVQTDFCPRMCSNCIETLLENAINSQGGGTLRIYDDLSNI
jgi:hypothetical protein